MMDSAIEKAEERIEYLSSDEEAMRLYFERERSLHERANMINTTEERGVLKGRLEGIEESKIEIARNLLDVLDNETIALKTGLSVDFIVKLR